MQFPKELRRPRAHERAAGGFTSMKCSSRRNCDLSQLVPLFTTTNLNEVQFPKELRLLQDHSGQRHSRTSMKCSSRRNCDFVL